MEPPHEGDVTVLERVEQIDCPQWMRAIESLLHHARVDAPQVVIREAPRDWDGAHVAAPVESRVVHPGRPALGAHLQPAPQSRGPLDPRGDARAKRLDIWPGLVGGRIEDRDLEGVAGDGLGLHPQDGEVVVTKRLRHRSGCLARGHCSTVAPSAYASENPRGTPRFRTRSSLQPVRNGRASSNREADPPYAAKARRRSTTVKSLTDRNEEQQLRLGLGQLLRYRYGLRREGVQVHAYLVCERKPWDSAWETRSEGVIEPTKLPASSLT